MKQLCFIAGVVLCVGAGFQTNAQTPSSNAYNASTPVNVTIAEHKVDLAKLDLQRITGLVEAGALPRVRIEQAQADLADAQDDVILARTLYGDLPVQNLTEQMADDMVAAAQRRLERQQEKINGALKLVADGITATSSTAPLEDELKTRELNLSLAHSRAKLISELAALAKYEHDMQDMQVATAIEYRDYVLPGMEHFEGKGVFIESRDLRPIQVAFASQFARPLPISADGETATHRSMGFDHRGRVDVALNPGAREGIWLRNYLKIRNIPYYAFTRAMAGKATAAHIHIGPGSVRLHSSAD